MSQICARCGEPEEEHYALFLKKKKDRNKSTKVEEVLLCPYDVFLPLMEKKEESKKSIAKYCLRFELNGNKYYADKNGNGWPNQDNPAIVWFDSYQVAYDHKDVVLGVLSRTTSFEVYVKVDGAVPIKAEDPEPGETYCLKFYWNNQWFSALRNGHGNKTFLWETATFPSYSDALAHNEKVLRQLSSATDFEVWAIRDGKPSHKVT